MSDDKKPLTREQRVLNLQDAGLNLTSRILTKTFNDLGADKITSLEAAKIISLLGLRVDNIVSNNDQSDTPIKFIMKNKESNKVD